MSEHKYSVCDRCHNFEQAIAAARALEARVLHLEVQAVGQANQLTLEQRVEALETIVHDLRCVNCTHFHMMPCPPVHDGPGLHREQERQSKAFGESWKAREGQIETGAFTGVPAVERRPDALTEWRGGSLWLEIERKR